MNVLYSLYTIILYDIIISSNDIFLVQFLTLEN